MTYHRQWRGAHRARTNWAAYHEAKRAIVSERFGGIDSEVLAAFFRLSPRQLSHVFGLYGQQFGVGAEAYARSAYEKWRQGTVQPSATTLERLLDIVPQVLQFATKVALYRQLRESHRKRETLTLRLRLPVGEELRLVVAEAWRIVERARAQPLPAPVDARLTWLSQGDGLAARQLVAAVELEEGVQVATMLREELLGLVSVLQLSAVTPRTHHVIELPYGTINVEFSTKKKWRWPMANNDSQPENKLPAVREERALARPIGDIIDQALQEGGSEEIVLAAQREALRLAGKQREGTMDSTVAKREIGEFIEQAQDASALHGMEFEGEADFKRASGRTHMKVKSKRRWWPFG